MAKYNRVEAPIRIAKEYNEIALSSEIGHMNTLKSYDKVKRYNDLYQEGYSIGLKGGSIDNELDLVEQNGEMVPKKEHRNFKHGYEAGLKELKTQLETRNTHLGR